MPPDEIPKLIEHFVVVPDPRASNARHPLTDILSIAILAVICGADTFTEIEQYGIAKEPWLRNFLELPHGIPSHDTFRRVFMILNPQAWQERFLTWVKSIPWPESEAPTDVIAIDGKRARGTSNGLNALTTVSVWAAEHGLVLAQESVPEGTNEITVIPQLLEVLDIAGSTITIDAAGTQKQIAWVIREHHADYVLALKNNHRTLLDDVKWLFGEHESAPHWRTMNEGHGRIETREYWLLKDLSFLLEERSSWRDLAGVGRVRASREMNGERSVQDRYFLTSLLTVEQLAYAVRAHWGIENGLHWVLDVAFSEDQSRVRSEHAQANLVTLRHVAVNLLKRDSTVKAGVRAKRMRAAWDDGYLQKILNA